MIAGKRGSYANRHESERMVLALQREDSISILEGGDEWGRRRKSFRCAPIEVVHDDSRIATHEEGFSVGSKSFLDR